MSYEIANGKEDDGIAFRVHLEGPEWVATVTHPDGTSIGERWKWFYEPRLGPDVMDSTRANETLDRLIEQLRQPRADKRS